MKMKKRLLGILLSLVMVMGLIPGMSLTAYADDDPPYAQYKNTTTVIKFDEKDWYLINYDTSMSVKMAFQNGARLRKRKPDNHFKERGFGLSFLCDYLMPYWRKYAILLLAAAN